MKSILLIALVAIAACNLQSEKYFSAEVVESHKNPFFNTYSYEEHPFKGWSYAEIKKLVGLQLLPWNFAPSVKHSDNDLPENFDSREKWPECIHPIRDQGHCGSCWAHAASEVLSDRFCIAGKVDVVLSPQDMVSCDYLDHGCNGGMLPTSWAYLKFFGIVTDSCKPYVSGDGHNPGCPLFKKQCQSGEEYKKYKAKNFYLLHDPESIKAEIFKNGPVETGFKVYEDFMSYSSGIYKRTSNKLLGGHAVKIVGWGNENGTNYWIVANSWSPKWGIKGFFKIAWGECDIDSNVIAGEPSV